MSPRVIIPAGLFALLLAACSDDAVPAPDVRADLPATRDRALEGRGTDAPGVKCGGQVCGAEQICCGPPACGHCIPKNSGAYCPPTCPDAASPDGKKAFDGGGKTACGPLQCTTATEVCVIKQAWSKEYACQPVPSGCEIQRTCACAGKSLCTGAFDSCSDGTAGSNIITCNCPAC